MSSGKASATGPGRPEVARWKAWLTSSGMRRASSISATHLVTGPNMRRKSISWKASRSVWSRATWPISRMSGVEFLEGSMQPDRGIGGAGPAGHEADAGAASELAIGLGHVAGAALLPADEKSDLVAGLEQRVGGGQVALPGTPKAMSTPWI